LLLVFDKIAKEAPKTKFLVKKPPTDAVKFKLEEE